MTTRELQPLEVQAIRHASVRLIEVALELMRSPEDLEARGTLEETARKIYDEAALIFEAVTEQEGP